MAKKKNFKKSSSAKKSGKKKSAKKKTKKKQAEENGKVAVHKVKDQNLLDEKFKDEKKDSFSVSLAATFLTFLIFAAGIFVYFFFFHSRLKGSNDYLPTIVVPESAYEELESEKDQPPAGEEEPAVEVLQVRVTETPTGYLNVRTGPGTNYSQIGRVAPGETFEYVGENPEGTWFEMKLDAGTGWVIKQYAELVSTQQ